MNGRDDRGRQKSENKKELWNFLDGIMPKAEDAKPPSFHVPNITRRKLVDGKMMLATEGLIQQEFPDQSSFTVVSIDPSIYNIVTATVISSDDENVMQNMSIPRSGDAFSTKVYQAQTWALLSASVGAHVVSVVWAQQALRAFYSSGLFNVKAMPLKQARTLTLDKGISHIRI
ncbi:hypothetical protein EDD21DRAFT_435052 [Dissophora ornata]|nr:hypothetical protein EDD21DRAFT_435052 [Dissophora ornata]